MRGALSANERESAVLLGQRIRAARERAGLSLREVAQRVGLRDHTVLIKYERGETALSSVRLRSIAQAVGYSAAALLATHDDAITLINAIDQASRMRLAQIEFVLEQLDAPPPAAPEP